MKKSISNLLIALFLASTIGVSVYAVTLSERQTGYRNMLEASYQKSFYSMVTHMNNIEINLDKLMVAGSDEMRQRILTEVSRNADEVETNLGQLPLSTAITEKTMKFVNQLGDYSKYLSDQAAMNKGIDAKATKSLNALRTTSSKLNGELVALSLRISEGQNSLADEGTSLKKDLQTNTIGYKMKTIGTTDVDYPELIYDGPFSDKNITKKAATIRSAVSKADCARKLKALFGGRVEFVQNINAANPTFQYHVPMGDRVAVVQMTQRGGMLSELMLTREVGKETKTIKQCAEIAKAFVKKVYRDDMAVVWSQKIGSEALINLTPTVGGAAVYSDIIKITLALDNGQIIGIDASNYIANHTVRKPTNAKITLQEAAAKVSKNLQVNTRRLALTPKSSGETLCYEFTGTFESKLYIVYINATTGEEQDIFQVVDAGGASLVV